MERSKAIRPFAFRLIGALLELLALCAAACAQNLAPVDFGAELSTTWHSGRRWKLSPALSFVNMDVRGTAVGQLTPDPANSPRHTAGVRSSLNVTRNLHWDGSLASVGSLSTVPSYTRIDTRAAWRLGESAEFSVTGQNLLASGHSEFPDEMLVLHTQARRDVTGKITWRF